MRHMHFCYCNECKTNKGVVKTNINKNGVLEVTLDCTHTRRFMLQLLEI